VDDIVAPQAIISNNLIDTSNCVYACPNFVIPPSREKRKHSHPLHISPRHLARQTAHHSTRLQFNSLFLCLESSRLPSSTRALAFASLGDDSRSGVTAGNSRSGSEVSAGLSRSALPTEKDGVLSSGRPKSQLIEGKALASGTEDCGSSLLSETLRSYHQLGHLEVTSVIHHRSHHNTDLALTSRLHH